MNSTFSPAKPAFSRVLNYFIARSKPRAWYCIRVTFDNKTSSKMYAHSYNDAQFVARAFTTLFSNVKNIIVFNRKGKLAYYKMDDGKLEYSKFKQA